MVHIQEPEPFEFTLLDELISNLTASDEESLGLCKYFSLLVAYSDYANKTNRSRGVGRLLDGRGGAYYSSPFEDLLVVWT